MTTPVGSFWEDMPGGLRIPSGLIAMWHGAIVDIPAGWVICDGNNSTPNLLTKFVEGVATAATDPGAVGGATSKELGTTNRDERSGVSTSGVIPGTPMMPRVGNTVGDSAPHCNSSIPDIRPLYYDVAFVMKT